MTNEEAIRILMWVFYKIRVTDSENIYDTPPTEEEIKQAGKMAIEALEQKSCEDCISRREAIKKFTYNYKGERIPDYDCDNFPVQIDMKTVKEILRELPSVNPQPCEDVISRQTALGCCRNEWEEEVEMRLKSLPPVNAQPKTGHWISLDDFRGKYNENGFMCSECNEHSDYEANYCPSCGAKMQEVEE